MTVKILILCFISVSLHCHVMANHDDDIIDPWPDGPYAMPMSVYGCPGTEASGWRTGYVNMVFRQRLTFDAVTHARHASLLGPFSERVVQLNFCFKLGPAANTTQESTGSMVHDNSDSDLNSTLNNPKDDSSVNDSNSTLDSRVLDSSISDSNSTLNIPEDESTAGNSNSTLNNQGDESAASDSNSRQNNPKDDLPASNSNATLNNSVDDLPASDTNSTLDNTEDDLPANDSNSTQDSREYDWPAGDYGVYRADRACPQGFSNDNITFTFPPLLHINMDGHLPDITFKESNSTFQITIYTCYKEETVENSARATIWEEPLILLPGKTVANLSEGRCPDFPSWRLNKRLESLELIPTYMSRDDDTVTYNQNLEFEAFEYCIYAQEMPVYLNQTSMEDILCTDSQELKTSRKFCEV